MNTPELEQELQRNMNLIVDARFGKRGDDSDTIVFFDADKRKAFGLDRAEFMALLEARNIPYEGFSDLDNVPGCNSFWVLFAKQSTGDIWSVVVTIPPMRHVGTA